MSTIEAIAAIFEEELKTILAEKQAKKGKKPEYHEEHYLTPEELRNIVDFLKKYLSSSSINVEEELERLTIIGGRSGDS
jgi:hypothetical protein